MTHRPAAQRVAGYLLRRASGRLPAGLRDDRYREWSAELPAILRDPDIRFAFLRSARALRYAAGVARSTRGRPAVNAPPADIRQPGIFPRPDGIFPAAASVAVWIALIAIGTAFPAVVTSPGRWQPLLLAVTLVPSVLMAIAVIRFVRWFRRRSRRTPHP